MAPNDPLFLETTFDDCVVDYWAHRHAEDPELRNRQTTQEFSDELDDMEAEVNARMAEQLAARLGREVEADGAALIEATQRAVDPPEDDWEVLADDGR